MILCALCSKAVGLPGCQKREDSLSVSAASGWPVNFYSRIHFQYTHFSRTNQPTNMQSFTFHQFCSNPSKIPFILEMCSMRRYHSDWFPRWVSRGLVGVGPPSWYLLLPLHSYIWRRKKIITLQIWLDLFALLAQTLVCTHHSLPKAKRDFICKIPIHKQLRSRRFPQIWKKWMWRGWKSGCFPH